MQYVDAFDIITKQVLNENTGELEKKKFRQEKTYKSIKGGFKMVYSSYDDALLKIVKSSKDLEIVLIIRNMFTYARIENAISKQDLALIANVSSRKASSIIEMMVETGMLMRVSRGIYRLNPFMYLPYRSDAEELQRDWKELLELASVKTSCT